jgi:hypothetical protein
VFRREVRLETIVHALGDLAADVAAGIWQAALADATGMRVVRLRGPR